MHMWTHEHDELMKRTARRIVDEEINPNVDDLWEEAGQFPAHHVMKLLGDAGLIDAFHVATDYGGLDLDYSYEVACRRDGRDPRLRRLDRHRCPNQHVYSGAGEVWQRRAPFFHQQYRK